jgi:hypothetical protein
MATATYIPIATQTLGSAASSITFSSIPNTYTDLRLVLTGTTASSTSITFQFNGDTGYNYGNIWSDGYETSFDSNALSNGSYLAAASTINTSTTVPVMVSMDVFSYADSTNKTALLFAANDQNGSGEVDNIVGLWSSTSAITSIKIFTGGGANLSTGTIATLWGI